MAQKVKKIENGQEIRTFYPSGKLKSIGVYKNNSFIIIE